MSAQVIRSADPALVLRQLVQRCVDRSTGDSVFAVGVSGGSVPLALSRALEHVRTDWTKWRVFLCDERLVPRDSPDNTAAAVRQLVLPRTGLTEHQLECVDETLNGDPTAAAVDYERRMRAAVPRFDVLVLGVGPDGHTCSLFAEHALLAESSRWVAPITDSPKPPPTRVTMTLPVLNAAKCVIFYATGAAKADIVRRIVVESEPLPAALVCPTDGDLYWVVDADSARLIPDQMLSDV